MQCFLDAFTCITLIFYLMHDVFRMRQVQGSYRGMCVVTVIPYISLNATFTDAISHHQPTGKQMIDFRTPKNLVQFDGKIDQNNSRRPGRDFVP